MRRARSSAANFERSTVVSQTETVSPSSDLKSKTSFFLPLARAVLDGDFVDLDVLRVELAVVVPLPVSPGFGVNVHLCPFRLCRRLTQAGSFREALPGRSCSLRPRHGHRLVHSEWPGVIYEKTGGGLVRARGGGEAEGGTT